MGERLGRRARWSLLVTVGLAGCATDTGDLETRASPAPEFRQLAESVEHYIDGTSAQRNGVELSPDQREQIEEILARGTVSFDDVRDALERTFACFEAAGVTYSPLQAVPASDSHPDYPTAWYSHGSVPGLDEVESLALADACLYSESHYVEALYQMSPGYNAVRDDITESSRHEIEACLEDAGVVLDPADTRDADELNELVSNAFQEGFPVMPCLGFFP